MSSENAGPRFRHVAELDVPVAEALLRWSLCLADTKHQMGLRLSEWVNSAPTLEAAVGASAMTQDELGHARSFFAMLRQFPGAPPELATETDLDRTVYFNPRLLDHPLPGWVDVIAVNVLLDRALALAIKATRGSAFAPLGQRAAKILQEEHFHRLYGDGWLARLAKSNGQTRQRLQAALNRVWPAALAWFGPADDPTTTVLAKSGVLVSEPAGMSNIWLETVSSVLAKHELAIPSTQLDWRRWSAERRDIE